MNTMETNAEVIGNYKLISVIGKGSYAIVYKGEKIDNKKKDNGKEINKNRKRVIKKALSSETLEINEINNSKLKRCSSDDYIKDNKENKENAFVMPNIIAIKSIIKARLNKKLAVNLRLEINILLKIKHQHIVQLYGIEPMEKTINLLMEYCEHGDLSLFMKKNFSKKENNPLIGPWKGFNEYIVLEFLFQLASALKYMNEKSVVHRDLKPQNILLTVDPNRRLHPIPKPLFSNPASYCLVSLPFLKLADFGFARSLAKENLASTLCGSPLYMAPEILDGKTYSANVDLWSLGTILYELVMSRTPYNASNHVDLLNNIKSSSGIHFPGEKTKSNGKDDSSDENLDDKDTDDITIPITTINQNKDVISDTSDEENISNKNKKSDNNQDQSNNNNLNEMSKYSKDPNAFCSPLKELIRGLLKQKSKERISFQDFFDTVDYQLKPRWETYRKQFNEILIEKEKELLLNDEIKFDYNEKNSKINQFIPLPSNFKSISKQSEIISSTAPSTKVNTINNSASNSVYQSSESTNIPQVNSEVDQKQSNISSFDESNYQIIQTDNIYSDGKEISHEEEKINGSKEINDNAKKFQKSISFKESQIKEKNEPIYNNTNSIEQNDNENNTAINIEKAQNHQSNDPFDYTVKENKPIKSLPFHKRFYSFPNNMETVQYFEEYHQQRQKNKNHIQQEEFTPTFSSSINSNSLSSNSNNLQNNSSSDNNNSNNIDSFDANIMNKMSIHWDPSQYNHIFKNTGHNPFKSTTYQFQKYSPYNKKHWRRASQPYLLNCHSFPEKRFSFSEKPVLTNNKIKNVLNNNLFPLSKINSNENLVTPKSNNNTNNNRSILTNNYPNNSNVSNISNININNNTNNNSYINNNDNTIPVNSLLSKTKSQLQPQTKQQYSFNFSNQNNSSINKSLSQNIFNSKNQNSYTPSYYPRHGMNSINNNNNNINITGNGNSNGNDIGNIDISNQVVDLKYSQNNMTNENSYNNSNITSQALNERLSHMSLKENVTRNKPLSHSKSNSLEKLIRNKNIDSFRNIMPAANTTTTTMDNEITERNDNDDSPFPFINSLESRSRSYSSSSSSSTTILERISLKNLNGGINNKSRSSLNSLDNSPKLATPIGSIPESNKSSFSQKRNLISQLSQVPDIFNAPQMDFEEMAPFPELFNNSNYNHGKKYSKSRKVRHSYSYNALSNHSGSTRSNRSSNNSLLYKSNSLTNNNSNYLGSCSSNGSMIYVNHNVSNSKSYSSGSLNLVSNNSNNGMNSTRSNLYINTLANKSNNSGASFGSCNNSPFSQEKFNGILFNNKHQSNLKSKTPSNSSSYEGPKIGKSYSTNFIQDPSIDTRNKPSPPFVFSDLNNNKKPNSLSETNLSKNDLSTFNNYTPQQNDKYMKMNDLTIREEGYIIVDENAVKLNCYADDLSTKEMENTTKIERNILKLDLQTFTHDPKINHKFNKKISDISICAYSIQIIAEKYISFDSTTAVTLYLKALSLYQHSINIAKSLSTSLYEQLNNEARHELYILIQWVRDQYNECLELVSDLYVDENKNCEIVEDIIWNEALLLAIQTEQQEKMGINLKQCERAYLQSIYYLKSLLINNQDINNDESISIPYSVQISTPEIKKVKHLIHDIEVRYFKVHIRNL